MVWARQEPHTISIIDFHLLTLPLSSTLSEFSPAWLMKTNQLQTN